MIATTKIRNNFHHISGKWYVICPRNQFTIQKSHNKSQYYLNV